MLMRIVTIAAWAGLGASLVAWGLHLGARGLPVPAEATALGAAAPVAARHAAADWQRVLGTETAPPPAAEAPPAAEPGLEQRLRLVGLAGPRELSRQGGVVLIAIDGAAPRAFRLGQTVEGRNVVQRVGANTVEIGPPGTPPAARLEMPALPPPATGTLAAAMTTPAPGMPPTAAALARPAFPGPGGVPPMPSPAQRSPLPP